MEVTSVLQTEIAVSDQLRIHCNAAAIGLSEHSVQSDNRDTCAGDKVVIDAGMELTAKGGGSFLKLDPSGVTLSGPNIRINAGGAAGRGSGLGILLPAIPALADMARNGSLLSNLTQERYAEQCRFVTCHNKPIPGLTAAMLVPGESAPQIFRSDSDGRSSRIATDQSENLEVHLLWDELEVPDSANDYLKSRAP